MTCCNKGSKRRKIALVSISTPSDETYTKATLAPAQPVLSGEQKVCWNVNEDQLRFGFANIAHHARQVEPTK